jgi:MerR family copper efflux transcriptional regulator
MTISLVAERSGILPKTIGYYESIGLIPSADRRTNGYRSYDVADVHTLQFIRRARDLGFSVGEVLTCWICGRTASAPAPRSRLWRPGILVSWTRRSKS